ALVRTGRETVIAQGMLVSIFRLEMTIQSSVISTIIIVHTLYKYSSSTFGLFISLHGLIGIVSPSRVARMGNTWHFLSTWEPCLILLSSPLT
ncbi:MAG: hypothetical protein ACW98J_05885, partial [Candidatus Thorarchaeota archaeon]